MHATYLFLLDELTPETDDPAQPTDGALAATVGERWAEHTDKLRENNWYQEEAVVFGDGRVLALCPADDWRGRDSLATELLTMPEAARWPYMVGFAGQVAALDLGFRGASPLVLGDEPDANKAMRELPFAELMDLLHTETAQRLAKEYEWLGLLPHGEPDRQEDWLRWYGLGQTSRAFTFFERCTTRPFAEYFESAYDPWRCYDLRRASGPLPDTPTVDLAILAVDIHT
jgi:hypothetical protein